MTENLTEISGHTLTGATIKKHLVPEESCILSTFHILLFVVFEIIARSHVIEPLLV